MFTDENILDQHAENHLLRQRIVIEKRESVNVVIQGKSVVNFCSNDYLNLSQHPKVMAALIQGVNEFGLGSGASNMVAGYFKPQYQLEQAFCEFLNRDRAIFFNSGYHANLGVITALAKKGTVLIADKLCHASLIDGILLSGAKHFRYPHQNLQQAELLLTRYPRSLLMTESVFSMQGNIADVKQLAALAKQSQALLLVDDAHGIGVLGLEGKGICEQAQLSQEEVPCLILPLGKAFASSGAIVAGDETLIETILQLARTYCYTTALPPAMSYATIAVLKLIREESWRREKLRHLSQLFITAAKQRGLELVSEDETPIKSILIGANHKVIAIQNALLEKGFFVSCIRPPTVPRNTARIRVSLNCSHTEAHIIQLLDHLQACQITT